MEKYNQKQQVYWIEWERNLGEQHGAYEVEMGYKGPQEIIMVSCGGANGTKKYMKGKEVRKKKKKMRWGMFIKGGGGKKKKGGEGGKYQSTNNQTIWTPSITAQSNINDAMKALSLLDDTLDTTKTKTNEKYEKKGGGE